MSKVLLVIDLQNDCFPEGKFPLWNTEVTLQNIEHAVSTRAPLVSLSNVL